jgi:hypothetical protein
VTVFRARDENELQNYALALQGKKTRQRFSLLLDDVAFNPEQHNFVGFGEEVNSWGQGTVSEALASVDYRPEELGAILLSVGLGGLASTNLIELNAQQAHILRLLVAFGEPNKVLVVNDPFELIPSEWRDVLAEMFLDFAWKKQGIVIVTKLSYRPPSWIENEIISRIQLEKPRQATIGFGGASEEAMLIQKLRAEFKASDVAPTQPQPGLSAAVPRPRRNWEEYLISRTAILSYCAVICLCLGLISWGMGSVASVDNGRRSISIALIQPPLDSKGGGSDKEAKRSDEIRSALDQESKTVAKSSAINPLDRYPQNIKDAVIESFERPEEVIQSWYRSAKLKPSAPRPVAVVATKDDSFDAEDYSSNQEDSDEDESELEARREEIRKKFLEAIQAAG